MKNINCLNCNKQLLKHQKKFCSSKCCADFQYKKYIKRWHQGLETGLSGRFSISKHIRHYFLDKNDYKCQKCGWGEINPFTNTFPLEIHHIDGDYRNNSENNLELLCPNCHSLTEGFKGANRNGRKERRRYAQRKNYCIDCGIPISSTSTRCRKCASQMNKTIKPITRDELKKMIRHISFTQIALKYGVTDNTIRKWCDSYNLPRKKTEINKYSDIEWEKI